MRKFARTLGFLHFVQFYFQTENLVFENFRVTVDVLLIMLFLYFGFCMWRLSLDVFCTKFSLDGTGGKMQLFEP